MLKAINGYCLLNSGNVEMRIGGRFQMRIGGKFRMRMSGKFYANTHCMNASPSNRAREVFENKVLPQLEFNNGALRKRLVKGAIQLRSGAFKYKVDRPRLDEFFTALSCGIVYKSCGSSLPENFVISHIFHNFQNEAPSEYQEIEDAIDIFYAGKPMDILEFGDPDTKNVKIYTVAIFGIPEFQSSITIVHTFFGVFKVTSMLTRVVKFFEK